MDRPSAEDVLRAKRIAAAIRRGYVIADDELDPELDFLLTVVEGFPAAPGEPERVTEPLAYIVLDKNGGLGCEDTFDDAGEAREWASEMDKSCAPFAPHTVAVCAALRSSSPLPPKPENAK